MVGGSLLDGDHLSSHLGTLLLSVVVVARLGAVIEAGALVRYKLGRANLLLPCLQVWLHTDVGFLKIAVVIGKCPDQFVDDIEKKEVLTPLLRDP